MQRIVDRFDSFAADIRALRGLSHAFWHSTRSAIAGSRARRPAEVAAPAPRLERGREWELVTGLVARDISRARDIPAIQARIALKLDAAEHAYNRIVADCARAASAAPTFRPARRPAHRSEPDARQPLAA